MMKLLTDKDAAFLNWVRLCNVDEWNSRKLQIQRDQIAKPLYYASLAGLTEASHNLLEMGVDVKIQEGHYGNALQAAFYPGHEAMEKLLI